MLGASRKRFIGTILGRTEGERELGTAMVNAFGIAAGAHILRVHDVAFHREAVRMAEAVLKRLCSRKLRKRREISRVP